MLAINEIRLPCSEPQISLLQTQYMLINWLSSPLLEVSDFLNTTTQCFIRVK